MVESHEKRKLKFIFFALLKKLVESHENKEAKKKKALVQLQE